MKIGIDISQMAYEGTGVGNYTKNLVENLLKIDKENEYVLFFSSLRKNFQFSIFNPSINTQDCPERSRMDNFQSNQKVKIKEFKIPLTFLDFLWNRLHIFPIEWFVGEVDVFITSDWIEPPVQKAKKVTILYDLTVYKYPQESDKKIVETQKRKLCWVKKESDMIICISEATKRDAMEILGIEEKRLRVIYPAGQFTGTNTYFRSRNGRNGRKTC